MKKNNGIISSYDLQRPAVRLGYALIWVFLILVLLVCLLPILWIMFNGFKDQKEFIRGVKDTATNFYYPRFLPVNFDVGNYLSTWATMKFYRYYLNSLISVVGCVVCAVVFNGLLAYGLSHLKPRGYRVVQGLIMASLMLPATTSMAPLFVNLTRLKLTGTFLPLWLCMGANAFYVVLFKNFYDGMPDSLLEAARLDGCSDLQMFLRIVLPLSMPINMVIVIYAVNAAWSDFLLPYLVLNGTRLETVMVRLFTYRTSDRIKDIEIIRAIVFSLLPPVILFILFQRQITQNVMSAGIKG
ncbi:MAG: carbohydrate ABC transporter permease [Candidatus Limiplasma sp.]|nr:carbohydrate ABC transporter permease [Candidatus Limiplasma sp.]